VEIRAKAAMVARIGMGSPVDPAIVHGDESTDGYRRIGLTCPAPLQIMRTPPSRSPHP
jgi:hypothetical protein